MINFDFHLLSSDPVLSLALFSFFLFLIALPFSFWSAFGKTNSSFVRTLVAIGNLCLTASLLLRWWQSGHFPISNLYESLCFLSWASSLTQLLVERNWSSPLIPAFVTPVSLSSIAFACFLLPDRLQESAPLVPALRSSWLVMHVSVIMTSYAALLVGSALSIAVLLVDRTEKVQLSSNSMGTGAFRGVEAVNEIHQDTTTFKLSPIKVTRLDSLDSISYRIITVGFLLLTVGLVSGAVWANEAWGSWWSWDPKETWALISWLVYAAYLHTRITRGWEGRKPALLAVAGLFVICICYIGVNLLGVGLHSYGWFF